MNGSGRTICYQKLLLLSALSLSFICQAADERKPHIGYLYPAGGRQGSEVYVTVGGQFLRGATNVDVSGFGVKATVVKYYKPIFNINREERELLQSRFAEVRDKRLVELGVDPDKIPKRKGSNKPKGKSADKKQQDKTQKSEVKMLQHPLFEDLDGKSLRDLAHIREMIFESRKKSQRNRQLAEMVLLKVNISNNARPGFRELRIQGPSGLTNPISFQVDQLPEIRELEPNDERANPDLPQIARFLNNKEATKTKLIELPVVLNGQIMPGDVDRFRFKAKQGQNLVIETHARNLIPYLADAVPGWFQAVVSLYDEKGNEVAFADDYKFNPDPVLLYKIPKTGEYELQIRDSIYRGREDFVYRISVSERPFVTGMFPLSGKISSTMVASVEGWNLEHSKLPLDTRRSSEDIRELTCRNEKMVSNPLTYTVNKLPHCTSNEPNDTIKTAQRLSLPTMVNGRIDKSGDVDVYELSGKAGEKIVAEVYARRLNSPVDSLLRLTDSTGKVIALNDDYVIKEQHLHKDISGLVTHHADSYLTAKLPKNGKYYLHISDTQQQGGSQYAYSLRVGPPQPDYELRMTPSSLSVTNGRLVPFTVYVLRKDGFDGEVKIVVKDKESGFKIGGARIPPKCDRIRMTLEAPVTKDTKPVALTLFGVAKINGRTVRNYVIPAEDMMQAFLYRHLVPCQQLKVAVKKTRWKVNPFQLIDYRPARIKAGDSITVKVKTYKPKSLQKIDLELIDAPEGVSVSKVINIPQGFSFRIMTDKNVIEKDIANNLIVETFATHKQKQEKGKAVKKARRSSMGVLPAIPIEVISEKKEQVAKL